MSQPEDNEQHDVASKPWSQRAQDVAAVIWPSFLVAAAATMVAFAMIDPSELESATAHGWRVSRLTGYSIGFFFFWLVSASSGFITLYLLRTRSIDRTRGHTKSRRGDSGREQ